MPSTDHVIQTHHLSKHFGDIRALNGLDLDVPKNSITGLLGPNGSGKTTLIKLLLGLFRPTHGSGEVFGLDIQRQSPEVRRRVGYLSQEPHFYPEMTARDILRFTAQFFYTGPTHAIDTRVDDMLGLVGLADRADRPVKGFSGGERQRLGIAQAQINEPDLLILDEPASALDPAGRLDVLNIMSSLREKTTIFYATHILDDVQRVSDRVLILNQGELIAHGPIEELLSPGKDVVYFITFEGEPDRARKKLESLSWIANLSEEATSTDKRWRLAVSDPVTAKQELLPLLVSFPEMTVLSYGRQARHLEEVFMQVVSGGNHES